MVYIIIIVIVIVIIFVLYSYIRRRENTNDMKSNTEESFVRSTKEGKLYIKTSDFFKHKKVKETIRLLINSDLIKEIDKRKSEKK